MHYKYKPQRSLESRKFNVNQVVCKIDNKPSEYSCLKVVSPNYCGSKCLYYYTVVSLADSTFVRSISNITEDNYRDVTDYAKQHFPEYLI